ncbi:MAG: sugar phosphate isomerase/epimerase family protein [bacterium]
MKGINSEGRPFRIGNQTSYAARYPLLPFEYAVAGGFDAFEWFPDKKGNGAGFSITDINHRTRRSISQTARANGITLSVHAPGGSDPFTPMGHDHMLQGISFAREIGATLFTIHLCAEAVRFIPAIDHIMEHTAAMGISLAIENTPHTSPEDINGVFSHLRASRARKASHVGMCLDLGHANLSPSTVNDYLRFFDRLDPEVPIIHVHLHENFGDRDSHLLVFTGPSARDTSGLQGFLDRLKKRGFSGSIILEQWPDPPSLLNRARERLLVMADQHRQGNGTVHARDSNDLEGE